MVTPWTVCCPRCGSYSFSGKHTYAESDGAYVEEYNVVRCDECNMRFIITVSFNTADMGEGEGDGTE